MASNILPRTPSMCNWCLQSSEMNGCVLNLHNREKRFFCSNSCLQDYDDNTCCGFCNFFTLAAMDDLSLRLHLNADIRKVFCSQQCLKDFKQEMAVASKKFHKSAEVNNNDEDTILQMSPESLMEMEKLCKEKMSELSHAMHQVSCTLETAHYEKDRLDKLGMLIEEAMEKEEEARSALQELDSRLQNLRDRRLTGETGPNLPAENLQQLLQELCYLTTVQTTKWAAFTMNRKALEREFLLQSNRPLNISELESCQRKLIWKYDHTMKIYGRIRERLINLESD